MKTILIHGMGNTSADFQVQWQAATRLNCPVSDLIPLYYEDLMDSTVLSGLTRLVIKAASAYYQQSFSLAELLLADYLQDATSFMTNAKLRQDIANRLEHQLAPLSPQEPITLVGYSLGGLIAVWLTLSQSWLTDKHPLTLATIACPLGSPLQGIATLIKTLFPSKPLKRPPVERFINVYSALDPLSGKLKNLGCDLQHRIALEDRILHTNVAEYLTALAPLLQ
ncbi:MAG: hypothetical protein VKK59_00145 [Vampirovibrionales bacterium]|nr:hypothetical protein [Vampirovibrionales bacterium]